MSSAALAAMEGSDYVDAARAFVYLSRKLGNAVAALEAWHDRAWKVMVIVTRNDVDFLAKGDRNRAEGAKLYERNRELADARLDNSIKRSKRIKELAAAVIAGT